MRFIRPSYSTYEFNINYTINIFIDKYGGSFKLYNLWITNVNNFIYPSCTFKGFV